MNAKKTGQTDKETTSIRFFINVTWKAALLFILCNLIFAVITPLTWLGKISAYNTIFPGRSRLPWSENPTVSHNLSLNNIDAMFASHEIAARKADDEFRVIFIGDSSVWGFLLEPGETYTSNINQEKLRTVDGKIIQAYNLGYPTISLTKDLLLLDYALEYQPDLVVWLVTLESFPKHKQIFTPLVENNPQRIQPLIDKYSLDIIDSPDDFVNPSFLRNTIIGQQRALADLFRLQLYGVLWAATGVDQDIPGEYVPRQSDFEADDTYYQFSPEEFDETDLAFEVLAAGIDHAGEVPVLIVNEPIFISQGENSQIRYNFLYPRWAYDAYRDLMHDQSELNGWNYLDMWNSIPADEFTNTAIHITPEASAQLASMIGEAIVDLVSNEIVE